MNNGDRKYGTIDKPSKLKHYALWAIVSLEVCVIFLCALFAFIAPSETKWAIIGLVVVLGVGVFYLGEVLSPNSCIQISSAMHELLPWDPSRNSSSCQRHDHRKRDKHNQVK